VIGIERRVRFPCALPILQNPNKTKENQGFLFCKKPKCHEKRFAFFWHPVHLLPMLQPLAIVFYERLMPGSQLINRLQDLNYRVLALYHAAVLPETLQREMPLFLIADLQAKGDICGAIKAIKQNPATRHVPVIAYAPDHAAQQLEAGQIAGANLAVGDSAITSHLPQLLDQALQVE
jgi:CheY-like chemotaxis protein